MLYRIEKRNVPLATGSFHSLSNIPHIHSHIELIYLREGSSVATVDNKDYTIERGDVFLSFPNQIHFYHDKSTVSGYLILFTPDLIKDFKDLFRSQVPTSPIIKYQQLPIDIRNRLKTIVTKNANSDSIFDKTAAKGFLTALIAELLPLMTLAPASTDHDSIKNILTYCSENYTEPLTLELLAKELHLNKYYISHIFKERMNIGFADFVNSLRIEHACNLLEKGSNITEIAFSSGFSSIRTFNRVFLQTLGMTPRDYIRSKETVATPVKPKESSRSRADSSLLCCDDSQLCCDDTLLC